MIDKLNTLKIQAGLYMDVGLSVSNAKPRQLKEIKRKYVKFSKRA